MLILGFDFGMKKIGIATGQTITRTATPLCQLKTVDGVPNWEEMDKIFQEWQPKACVIGLPFNADGSDSPLVPRARSFARKLQKRYLNIECHFIDEHLTSFEARQLMKGTKATQVDATAAMLILESWLASS